MSFEEPRVPEERGDLQPPRRHPPTAVGTATPPPPRRPGRARHRAHWSRIVAGILAFASPLVAGGIGLLLIRGDRGPVPTALGWTLLLLAAAAAAFLTWVAGVLPIRDHFRTRAADRLARAR